MKTITTTLLLLCFCILNFQCEKEITIPAPVFPADAARLSMGEADNMVFSWNAMKLRGQQRPSTYKVYVYEMDSINTQNEARQYFFSNILEQETEQAFLEYPSTSPNLAEGKVYTWKVALKDSSGVETVIKDFTSFSLESNLIARELEPSTGSFCTDCYEKVVGNNCVLTCKPVDCPTVIHVATGQADFSSPPGGGNRSMSLGAGNFVDGCVQLGPGNTIEVACKYKITVPLANLAQLGDDSVIFKVFKDQVLLPDAQFELLPNYESLRHPNLPDPFVLTPLDYEKVCINGTPFGQALILIQATFPIEYRFPIAFPKQYTMVFDFVPITEQGQSGMHVHTSTDNTYIHAPSGNVPAPCDAETMGSYQYYRCMENKEGDPDFHQSKHIVMINIPSDIICGYWNMHIPVPVAYQGAISPILPY